MSLKIISNDLVHKLSALFQVMIWYQSGSEPSLEATMTEMCNALQHHNALIH